MFSLVIDMNCEYQTISCKYEILPSLQIPLCHAIVYLTTNNFPKHQQKGAPPMNRIDLPVGISDFKKIREKNNRCLRFAVITGCLRVAKESVFTGTNNFVSDTITDSRYDEYFGFTQEDVERLLAGIFAGAGYMVESNREHG